MLTESQAALVADEEACLARVLSALGSTPEAAAHEGITKAELEALRDDAASAREEEAASLMLELAVQQQLRNRPTGGPRPDARSPYMAHLRLREGGEVRDYFLGYGTFVDTRLNVRVVDWRVAPVAQVFYRYREGEAFEASFPGREVTGTVEARRIVVVHGGTLVRIMADGQSLARGADGTWRSETLAAFETGAEGRLGLGVGQQERGTRTDVTALLDPSQYAAVSAPPDDALLVLGSAGSGKTTVALHRLARLTTQAPDDVPLPRARVVVPEEGLARLCGRLLKPLLHAHGPDVKPPVETLDELNLRLGRHALGKLAAFAPETPALVTNLKRHPAFFHALKERLAKEKGPKRLELWPLRRQLAHALTDRGFLASVVERAKGTLPTTCIEDTVRHTMLQAQDSLAQQLDGVDEERRTAVDGRDLAEDTPDALAQTIDLEDVPVLLAMLAWRGALKLPQASHLVLDEAEDFSLFDLEVLRAASRTARGVTLAGDEAQQTHSSFAGWTEALEAIGAKRPRTIRLETSYRCPEPIAALARHVLAHLAPARPLTAARQGVPVGRHTFPSEAQSFLFIAHALRELLENEPHASVAVVAHDDATAQRIHGVLADLPSARLVLDGLFTFEPGLDVTTVDCVKGLEFDYVVVPDATTAAWPSSDEGRRRLHVAVTRASHQLWLVGQGQLAAALGPG